MSFLTVPIRVNGQGVVASWWNLLRSAGLAVAGWEKYTVTHTQLQTAALTNDIELLSLGAKEEISGVITKQSIAFAGTSITAYTIGVGITGELDKYAPPFDVFQAVGSTVFDNNVISEVEDFVSATSVRVSAVSVGANLDQSTAGSVDIWIKRSALP